MSAEKLFMLIKDGGCTKIPPFKKEVAEGRRILKPF